MKKTPFRSGRGASATPRGKLLGSLGWLILAVFTARAGDLAATNRASLTQLAEMSPEELMDLKVTILGPSETVSRTPAAVSVVTSDDIERSGARNIPEALRLVPGLDVAQIDANQWAVSARGFNDEFADKLLVLQDGRSLYTPLFGGVFWDVQGTLLEDIDRIEVVRGPGATLWGANAVNGVINIITKSAEDTQGWLVSGGGGSQERDFGNLRYGGQIGGNAYYRVYGTFSDHAPTELPGGGDAYDSSQLARGGFRLDWNQSPDNLVTLQGDGYWGIVREDFSLYDPAVLPGLTEMAPDEMGVSGANALGRWTHTFSDTASSKLQAYYDYTERSASQLFDGKQQTIDLSWQDELAAGERNQLIGGLGYRLVADTERNFPAISFDPANNTLSLYSGFAQDEIALAPDKLSLTLGSKLEHNDYSGFEVEPGARLAFTPTERQTLWASISRAIRSPTRSDENVTQFRAMPLPPPYPPGSAGTAVLTPNHGFESETLIAYEIGYRTTPCEKLSFDATAFYNHYSRLRSLEVSSFSPMPPTLISYQGNELYGDSIGTEISATWRPAFAEDRWRLQPAYTFLKLDLHSRPGSTDTSSAPLTEGESPENQFSIRSSIDFPRDVTLDAALRYVEGLSSLQVPGYYEMDARLAWRINRHWLAAVVGQNLLHPQHLEFNPTEIQIQQTEIPRSVYAELTWQY